MRLCPPGRTYCLHGIPFGWSRVAPFAEATAAPVRMTKDRLARLPVLCLRGSARARLGMFRAARRAGLAVRNDRGVLILLRRDGTDDRVEHL